MTWNKDHYTKVGFFYIGLAHVWEWILYRFWVCGLGDLIYNTLRKIIETGDKSKWAHGAFDCCIHALKQNKRWPDYKQEEYKDFIARNWFEQRWYILRFKKKLNRYIENYSKDIPVPKYKIKYRPQKSITRDPHIAALCCAVHLGRIKEMNEVKIPWHLYRPKIWQWRKALLGKRNCYKFLNRFRIGKKKEFVTDLQKLMDNAIKSLNKEIR